jgi:hypothetical protein
MSKQNLNPSYWCIWCIKTRQKNIRIEKAIGASSALSQKHIKIEKVTTPQNKEGQELKKTND